MDNNFDGVKKVEINLHISEFEIPPMQDILIIGKRAPIGPEAARRVVDALSPDQYDIIKLEHSFIEAIVVRRNLLNIIPQEKLIPIIIEEGGRVANETTVVKVKVSATIKVSRLVDL